MRFVLADWRCLGVLMRCRTGLLIAAVNLVFPFALPAQEQNVNRASAQEQAVPTRDGGVNLILESIVVSSKPQSPFTITLETEWVRPLADGGSITLVNKRRIARDSSGRVYQERWFLVPKSGRTESTMTMAQIFDPKAGSVYDCYFAGPKKETCELRNYVPRRPAVNTAEQDSSSEMTNGQGSHTHQFLGKQMVSGVETLGVKETTTFLPGVFGNDRAVTVEQEEWYSPQLDLNLISVRSDPRTGKQTFNATTVILGEPDAALFELPEGFRVVDHRQTAAGLPNQE